MAQRVAQIATRTRPWENSTLCCFVCAEGSGCMPSWFVFRLCQQQSERDERPGATTKATLSACVATLIRAMRMRFFCRAWLVSEFLRWIPNILLVGGFNPSEKYESQWEGWHLIYEMENKIHAPNHQHFTHTLGYPISYFHLVLGWLHGFTYRSWQSLFSEPPLHKLCCGPHWDVLRARNLIQ